MPLLLKATLLSFLSFGADESNMHEVGENDLGVGLSTG